MLITINLLLITVLSLIFTNLKTPLRIGFILIIQTINMSIIIYLINSSSWYSYIILIIFLRALIVLFIYVSSLAANKTYGLNPKKKFFYLRSTLLITLFLFKMSIFRIQKLNIISFSTSSLIRLENSSTTITLHKIFIPYINIIRVIIILYLLITLLVSLIMLNYLKGPIKSIN